MHGNIVSLVDSTGVPLNKSGMLGVVGGGGAVDPELWNQDQSDADSPFNTYVRSWAYHILDGSSLIGRTLKTFTMRLKSTTATPASNVVTFGVWSDGNNSRTPDSEFAGLAAEGEYSNTDQLTTDFVDYSFTGEHVLAAKDNIGFACESDTVFDYEGRRADGVTVSDMKVAWYYNTTPDRWSVGSAVQIPVGTGSSD